MENLLANDKIEVILRQEERPEEGIQEEEISLAEILRVFLKGKWIIGSLVIAAILISFLYIKFFAPEIGNIQTIISFNYKGIERGLDPNGKNLDVSMIKSPMVMDQVVRALQLDQYDITSDDLRKSINITPVILSTVTSLVGMSFHRH